MDLIPSIIIGALATIVLFGLGRLLQSIFQKSDHGLAHSSEPIPVKRVPIPGVPELPRSHTLYCKFCKKFLDSQPFIDSHFLGKQHKKQSVGQSVQWYAFVPSSDLASFDPSSLDKPADLPPPPSPPPEEVLEPGWTK